MQAGFRASMNWLHTWSGVLLGSLLFAIFWMGTLAVFDKEIDRWMMPACMRYPGIRPTRTTSAWLSAEATPRPSVTRSRAGSANDQMMTTR